MPKCWGDLGLHVLPQNRSVFDPWGRRPFLGNEPFLDVFVMFVCIVCPLGCWGEQVLLIASFCRLMTSALRSSC